MASDVEQLFMCLLAIHVSAFFGETSFQIFGSFLIELLVLLHRKNSLYILNTDFLSENDLQIFSPSL